jgi:hypothetical protein
MNYTRDVDVRLAMRGASDAVLHMLDDVRFIAGYKFPLMSIRLQKVNLVHVSFRPSVPSVKKLLFEMGEWGKGSDHGTVSVSRILTKNSS